MQKTLVVISPLAGYPLPNGNILLTEKFIEGMKLYNRLWGGPILHICEPAQEPSHNLDNQEIPLKTEHFDTICERLTGPLLRSVIPKDSLVVASVGEQFNFIADLCCKLDVPCVYITEYSLPTRLQIIAEYQSSWLHGSWQKLRQIQQEFAQRSAISKATGVQCNGLPTFQAYNRLNRSPHLFFDTRSESLATMEQIRNKYFNLIQGKKLQLAFSGRLTRMKGVDDLLKVAAFLRAKIDDWFELSIFGDGDLVAQLKSEIRRQDLSGLVRLEGNVDFGSELVPAMSERFHLFVVSANFSAPFAFECPDA